MQRNLQACEGGYRWTTDPRLQGASAVKLTEGQIHSALKGLSMPTLLLLAEDPARQYPELADTVGNYIDRLLVEVVAGGHHFHMEPGVPEVARRVEHFLKLNQGPESV